MGNYNYKDLLVLQLEATDTESSKEFIPKLIKLSSIINFGSEDLLISINKEFADGDNEYLIIPAGLAVNYEVNEEVECDKIYYKTASGTTSFQFSGFQNWGGLPNSYN